MVALVFLVRFSDHPFSLSPFSQIESVLLLISQRQQPYLWIDP